MGDIKILLVEDDEDDRSFFRQAVLDSGIEAELRAVTDGRQLIDFFLDLPELLAPDVIFLDLYMPVMDGKSCLREIRRAEFCVVILSGGTQFDYKIHAFKKSTQIKCESCNKTVEMNNDS